MKVVKASVCSTGICFKTRQLILLYKSLSSDLYVQVSREISLKLYGRFAGLPGFRMATVLLSSLDTDLPSKILEKNRFAISLQCYLGVSRTPDEFF